jgi:hypothetical protein
VNAQNLEATVKERAYALYNKLRAVSRKCYCHTFSTPNERLTFAQMIGAAILLPFLAVRIRPVGTTKMSENP